MNQQTTTTTHKILVIEDDKAERQLVLTLLRRQGFETTSADNGTDGLRLAKTERPDLILCDIHLGGLDGYDLLAEIRKEPTLATVPFIFMTAHADREALRQGMGLGADDFLPKPFTSDELITAVNARLEKYQVLIRQANQKLDELRAAMSVTIPHELRTPLNGILGYADILRKQADDLEPSEIKRMAERIHKNGKRLGKLVENYIIYAQTELQLLHLHATKVPMSMQTLGTDRILRMVVEQKAEDFGRADDVEVRSTGASVNITPEFFTKIVDELVDNAFKFSSKGTKISVASQIQNSHLRLEISDQGRGMTPEQLSHIGAYVQFERKVYEQQGSGLGLTVARRLVELHGGKFEIKSAYGKGTTVVAELPLAEGLNS
ncbi:MAG TPA: response regulator [Bacteroidota bacterium]|nr:response regulator [Bacteroidota bacterium]